MAATPMPGPAAPPDGTIDTQLSKGAIGLPAVVMQALTHVAPAAGAIITIQFIAQLVGLTTPLAFLFAFLICLMLAASLTQLARHLPSAGGYYTYVSRTVGPRAGFMTAWLYFLYDPIQGGMNLAFAGWFMNSVLGTLYGVSAPWLWPITLAVGTVLITFLMYRGIQISGKVLVILGIVEILIFVCLAATGFVHSGAGGVSLGVFNPAHKIPHGGSMFLAVVFSIFAFTGFEACVPLAEESRRPRRNIPRAIMISIIVAGLFYVLISWGIISGWGTASLHGFEASTANPIMVVGKRLWGGAAVLILLAYLNSIFGACFSGNNAASRVFFGMGRSRALPAALGKVSDKTRTPTNAITLQAFLTLAVGFGMSLALGPANQLYLLATVITLGLSLVYIAGNIGVMRYYLTERRAELNPLLHLIFPVASSVALLVVCYKSVVPLPAWPVSLAPFITIGWIVVGLVVVTLLHLSGRAEWLQRAGNVLTVTEAGDPSVVAGQPGRSGNWLPAVSGPSMTGTAEEFPGARQLLQRDQQAGAGRQVWYFPDADLPWPDEYGPFAGHESLLILNVSARDADICVDLFWTDREPTLGLRTSVGAQRIACLHPPYGSLPGGADFEVPIRTQYAIRVRASVPVVCQYGRIECRPAFGMYTTMGWA